MNFSTEDFYQLGLTQLNREVAMKPLEDRMTIAELIIIGNSLYGEPWVASLAKEIDYEYSTVWRWANAKGKKRVVPKRAAKVIRQLAKRKKIAIA